MTDYRDYWVVCIGELYLGGLGTPFTNQACIGWVFTKLRDKAEKFTSLESAKRIAASLGGQVYKV